ncbi:MAG: hypothetical protein R6X29_02480 [Acidimicrobiia bacterium]|jgi:hypothetical protein
MAGSGGGGVAAFFVALAVVAAGGGWLISLLTGWNVLLVGVVVFVLGLAVVVPLRILSAADRRSGEL